MNEGIRSAASWINAVEDCAKNAGRLLVTKPRRWYLRLRLSFLSLNLRGKIKQVRTHTRTYTYLHIHTSGEREKTGCGWSYRRLAAMGRKETVNVKCVTRVKRLLAMRFIAARDCVPIQLCAREWRLRKRLCVGTIAAASAAVAAAGLLSAANPSRRPLLHATYVTRFIGANNCGRLYSKEGYSRVTREGR